MLPGHRMLPDGTWLNEATGTVSAPLIDQPRASATAGPVPDRFNKRLPSPPAGPGGDVFRLSSTDPQAVPVPLGEISVGKRILAIGAIVGVAGLTVWLQQRKKKNKAQAPSKK